MTINFHDKSNRSMYNSRVADESWLQFISSILPLNRIESAADIGCGGGIYTKALSSFGIKEVVGIDFSPVMIEAAKDHCKQDENVTFQLGDAMKTNLETHSFQLVMERALIHHIQDLQKVFIESNRVLTEGGYFLIQDRTPDDCRLKGSSQHIRGYIFDLYPELLGTELKRRHSNEIVQQNLRDAGFNEIKVFPFWETRKTYKTKEALLVEIKERSGRSILHELSDDQLENLGNYIDEQLADKHPIEESDRWTVWLAKK